MRSSVTREAIQSYAVLLNRVGWLAPERLDVQARVWTRLIEAEAGDDVISLQDFEQAITDMLVSRRGDHSSILPFDVIATAASIARDRAQRVREILRNHETPAVFLANALAVMHRSDNPDQVAAEVRWRIADDLAQSEVDDRVVTEVLQRVEQTLTDDLDKYSNPPALPG